MSEKKDKAVNNMQDLLKLAIEHHDPSSANEPTELDEERKQFLQNVLQERLTDPVKILKERIANLKDLKEKIQTNNNVSDVDENQILEILNSLIEEVGQIDMAKDFYNLGGFLLISDLFDCKKESIQIATLNLLAELLQNNEYCQNIVYEAGYMDKKIKLLNEEKNENIQIKIVYALSCLIRGNDVILNNFVRNDHNLKTLLNILETSKNEKLLLKLAFLVNSICRTNKASIRQLHKFGFIPLAFKLISEKHDASHEPILSILVCMMNEYKPSKKVFLENKTKYEPTLNLKSKYLSGKEEFLEEKEYCDNLLKILNDV